MALHLKPDVEKRTEEQMAAGQYSSADELVTEALDLLESHKQAVREELDRRYEEIKSGNMKPMNPAEARSRLKEHHQAFLQQR